MPTQEEVLEAIRRLGSVVGYADLRRYFNIEHLRGNSVLPQRLRRLMRAGLVAHVRGERYVFFVLTDRAPDPDLEA